jgi:hypothetical protein
VNTPPTPVLETREPCDGWGHGNRLAHRGGVLTCASRVPQTRKPALYETLLVYCLRNPPFFATAPCSHKPTRSDCIAGCGVLTACRGRDITSLSSWRPTSANHGHWAKLPEGAPRSAGKVKLEMQRSVSINLCCPSDLYWFNDSSKGKVLQLKGAWWFCQGTSTAAG